MSKETKKRTIVYSNVKDNRKKAEKLKKDQESHINLDDEFIIGLDNGSNVKKNKKNKKNNEVINNSKGSTVHRKKEKQYINQDNKSNNKVKNNKTIKKDNFQNKNFYNNYENIPRQQENNKKKKKIVVKLLVIFITFVIIGALIIGGIMFLRAPLFNIKKIEIHISNNTKLTELRIEDLMELAENQNMFSFKKKETIEKIKKDAYVENVKISKVFPNNLVVNVEERVAKYQIKQDGMYIYIDNQGYILEYNQEKNNTLVINGVDSSDLTVGNKLNENDQKALIDVVQIMQEAENNQLLQSISAINIKSRNNYIIYFDSIGKTAHLGNIKSINEKMNYVKKILETEKEYEGDIFVNVDLTKGERPFFREKV